MRPAAGPARVFYRVPDYDRPSWGVAMLYEHVRLLRELGVEASVLHERAPFRVGWIESTVPVAHLDEPGLSLTASDLVVMPEVCVGHDPVETLDCRRVVFVQGAFPLIAALGGRRSLRALGLERALTVLPHVADVVERHFDLQATVVPPLIADYFFGDETTQRQRRVLLYANAAYRDLGFDDLLTAERLLARELGVLDGWELLELGGLSHRRTAELFRSSALFVNLNRLEAFNTTVPEAMAAGCVPFCYEAYGGLDFLEAGSNAFVFDNGDVFGVVGRVLEVVAGYERMGRELEAMRRQGRRTAERYREAATRTALADTIARWL